MSVISVGTTLTTGLVLESDTTGNLVIKTGSGVTAMTISASQVVSFANPPSINGAGSIATVGKAIAMAIVFGG